MLRRLPISLKIDDEDGDFYYGFIEPKKNDRELSNLILTLLKLYHTNEIVQKEADDFMVSKSPYLKIHEELQRIALEHSKQTTTTSMLGDFNQNEMQKMHRHQHHEEPVVKEETKEPEVDKLALLKMLAPEISEMVATAVAQVQAQTQAQQVVQPVIQPVVQQQQQQQQPQVQPQIQVQQPISQQEIKENPIVDNKPIIDNKPVIDVGAVEEQRTEPKEVVDEGTVNKPKSFNKLLKSVK